MNLSIVKYNAGNVRSVLNALERLGVSATVTDDPEALRASDKVIFPGVGEASSAMRYLREQGLDKLILELRQPVLGICLGMQLMCRHSEENDTECLGIFDLEVRRFSEAKVPQVGWNQAIDAAGPLFTGMSDRPYFYFVHSYYADLGKETAATSEYGIRFSSALQKDNFYGVQFHPEKSAEDGELLIKNFLDHA
ncbi:MAG TPA: imidazole glycerol phosphate synthase subunit HisH [Flavisolibacter sp.]|nr:imidazole glycerol phosphate synthase subunit HisH [Flavisolibacter sp.]